MPRGASTRFHVNASRSPSCSSTSVTGSHTRYPVMRTRPSDRSFQHVETGATVVAVVNLSFHIQVLQMFGQIFVLIVTSPSVGVRSIACLYVCLIVCFSVRSHISKTARSNFIKFSLRVTCDRGSVLLRRHCNMLCTSGFVDNVVFSYNGPNTPELKTTRMFRPLRQVAAPGTKSAVSDSILLPLPNGLKHTQELRCMERLRYFLSFTVLER